MLTKIFNVDLKIEMEKYILDLLLRYRDHALIKDVLVDINESKLLEV